MGNLGKLVPGNFRGITPRSAAGSMRRCGACGKKFGRAKDLVQHLKTCLSANVGRKLLESAIDAGLDPNIDTH